eukprot:5384000-Pleurochrysis_carterae.AAC.12
MRQRLHLFGVDVIPWKKCDEVTGLESAAASNIVGNFMCAHHVDVTLISDCVRFIFSVLGNEVYTASRHITTDTSVGGAQEKYKNLPSSRSKAARGPSRSSWPTLKDHARLSQACSYDSDSLRGSTRVTTVRAEQDANRRGSGASAGARAGARLRRACAVARGRALTGQRQPSRAEFPRV